MFFVLGACGSSADFGGGTAGDGTQNTIVADQTNRKIVYYVRMSLKTKKIGAAKEELIEQGNGFGGYIFEQNEVFDDGNYSEVYLVFKIPTAKLDEFVSAIGEKGKDPPKILRQRISPPNTWTPRRQKALCFREKKLWRLCSATRRWPRQTK